MAIPTAGPILKALLALSGGVVLFTFLLLAALAVFGVYNAGQVYPGVSVAGVNVSGLSPEEAAAKLSQQLTYPQTGRIVFQGEQAYVAKPADLGLYLDPQINAWAAYHWGRQGNIFLRPFAQFKAWYIGADLPPLMVYDQRVTSRYLDTIAQQINRPTVEASLSVNGTDVTATPGQVGRELDIQATLLPLEARLRSLTDGCQCTGGDCP
jgi:vancomycin resistance protein YoaR